MGTLTFYDASGNVVTGGNNLDHMFAFAEASTTDPSTHPGNIANLEFANPSPGTDPENWTTAPDESSSFPNSAAPAPLTTDTKPVISVDADGADIAAARSGFTPNTTSGYTNTYEVRVYTTGPNGAGSGGSGYWQASILVDPTAGTWVETYPVDGATPTTTTTTIAVTPSPSAKQGQSVTVTATAEGTGGAFPTGSIEIDDGSQVLGTGAVNSSGQYAVTTSSLLPGTHSFTATFTDTQAGYSGSTTATATHYLVNPVAATPKITGTVQVGKTVTCAETTTSGETATYIWEASGTKEGTSKTLVIPGAASGKSLTCKATVNVSGGTASSATSAAKKVAEGAALKAKKKPTLSGKDKAGQTEKVAHGTWTPAASSYTYQWYLGSAKIKGATKASYKLVKKDEGKKISVKVTAKKTGYKSGTATTKSLKVKK